MAKEDARYVLPLATKTQMGMTINARSIEHLLRRLSNVNLLEAKEIRDKLLKEVRAISPSLIRYVDTDSFYINLQKIKTELFISEKVKGELKKSQKSKTKVEVIGEDMEERILAALVFNKYPQDYSALIEKLKAIPNGEKSHLFERIFEDIKAFHQVPKEFEMVDFTVQCSVSASCFAQLKRHRLMTIIRSEYKPEQGFVTPSVIAEIGEQQKYGEVLKSLEKIYNKLELFREGLGSYALTNAHRVNVVFKINLRELYHFSRLRSDQHAQWEIRELSQLIDTEVRKILPNAAKWLMGKDTFKTSRC
jgi:thymidylate synthase ThyX